MVASRKIGKKREEGTHEVVIFVYVCVCVCACARAKKMDDYYMQNNFMYFDLKKENPKLNKNPGISQIIL